MKGISEIVDLLSAFETGDFSKRVSNPSSFGILAPIIEKLNLAAKSLETRAESEKNREDRFRLAVETLNDGLVLQDSGAKIIQYNPAALSILGLTADQLLGRTSMDPKWKAIKADGSDFPGEDHPAMIALRTGEKVTGTLMGIELPTGAQRWLHVNATPYEGDKSANKRQVLVSFSDVTEMVVAKSQIDEIFSATLDLICIANTDGYFKRVNPSFVRILGYTETELLTQTFLSFIHPDDVPATMKIVEKLARGELLLHFENRYRAKSGEYRLISWHCQPNVKTGDLFAIGRDITELRKTELGFHQIMTALNETAIIAFTDAKGTITEVNDNFCKISGYSKEELIGKNHRIVKSEAHPKQLFQQMWKTISSGNSWSGDLQNRSKNGDPYWVRTVITPLMDDNKKVTSYLSIRFDVTAQKLARQEMKLLGEQLQEAQTIAKIGSWVFDLENHSLSWSTEHYKIFEIEEPQTKENLYKLYRQRIHPDDLAKLDQHLSHAQKTGEGFTYDHRLLFENGRVKHVQGIGNVTQDASGKPVRVSGTCQDMTERVQKEEESHFIIESLGIGIWKWDLVTNALEWDQNMYKLYGAAPGDFNGAYDAWESSLSAETKAKAVEEINRAVRGEKEFDTTFQVVHKTGKIQEIRTRAFVIRDQAGKPLKMYGINVDRNREAELETAMLLERTKAMKNAKLASLGEMSAGIAHEINNPVAIILGSVRLIPKFANDPEKLKAKVETIEKASNRIAKIVGGLRKFSRSSEKSDYHLVSLKSVVEEALILTDAKSNRHSTPVHIECTTEGQIYCDEIEIEQILVNLINNGIDAVQSLPEKWVRIKLFEDRTSMVLQIRDSGKGISKEVQKKLFHPFFTTKPVGQGTGLGLSIVKGILDDHKATIEVINGDSNTCFEIRFQKPEAVKAAA